MNITEKIRSIERSLALIKEELTELENYKQELKIELHQLSKVKLPKKHIADFLDCSPRTVTRMLDDGRLKSTMAIDVIEYKLN